LPEKRVHRPTKSQSAKTGPSRIRNLVVQVGKALPPKVGGEALLQIDYAIARFMGSKKAYKTEQNPSGVIFSMKRIRDERVGHQVHLHLRFSGRDRVYAGEDVLDIDVYVPVEEWAKAEKVLGVGPCPNKADRFVENKDGAPLHDRDKRVTR